MTATKLVTAKEFLALPDPSGLPVELVRGVVKDKRAEGATLNLMKIQLAMFLRDHVKGHGLGQVFMGLGHVLQRDPDTVRMIDISFVSRDRRDEVGISDGS